MNATPIHDLETLIRAWEGHWRWHRLLWALPRALMFALVIACLGTLFGRMAGVLSPSQALMLGGGIMGVSLVGLLVWGLRRRPLVISARHFDVVFDLQERVSTALEVHQGRIQTLSHLAEQQLRDALATARRVAFRQHQPFDSNQRDWGFVAVLCVALLVLMALPGDVISLDVGDDADGRARDIASETLRDITETVATSTTLTPEERQPLLALLEMSLEALRDEALSREEAFIIMSDIEQQLRAEANRLDQSRQALAQVSDGLSPYAPDAPTQDLDAILATIEENLEGLSPETSAQLGEALADASEASRDVDDHLAQGLQDASDALAEGDLERAQNALNQAQEALEERQTSLTREADASDDLRELADDAQQSAQDIAQSEQDEGTQGQPEEGEGSTGMPSDEGEIISDEGVPGAQETDRIGEDEAEDTPDAERSGTGESPSDAEPQLGDTSPTGGGAESIEERDIDGTDERTFEIIFAPQRLDAEGAQEIILTPDSSEMGVREGDASQNTVTDASVPYDEVFVQYASQVMSALEQGQIPPGLRDMVRDYFLRINPQP